MPEVKPPLLAFTLSTRSFRRVLSRASQAAQVARTISTLRVDSGCDTGGTSVRNPPPAGAGLGGGNKKRSRGNTVLTETQRQEKLQRAETKSAAQREWVELARGISRSLGIPRNVPSPCFWFHATPNCGKPPCRFHNTRPQTSPDDRMFDAIMKAFNEQHPESRCP